jgi:hypothetical protein
VDGAVAAVTGTPPSLRTESADGGTTRASRTPSKTASRAAGSDALAGKNRPESFAWSSGGAADLVLSAYSAHSWPQKRARST